MSLNQVFSQGKAVIPHLVCGYPNLATTEKLILALEKADASLIELGIPFSDAAADGPLIQRISEEVITTGVTTDQIFDLVQRVKNKITTPLALRTYANVVFSYGTERVLARAAEVGFKARILPDVPFEEKEEFASACNQAGISFISFVAPAFAARVTKIASSAQGYICLSLPPGGEVDWDTLRQAAAVPIAVPLGGNPGELGGYPGRWVIIDAAVMEVAEHGESLRARLRLCAGGRCPN